MMVFNEIYSEKMKIDILLAPECTMWNDGENKHSRLHGLGIF